MTGREVVRQEERHALKKTRQIAKLQTAAHRQRERIVRLTRAEIIREELAKPRARACRCGITPSMTLDDLTALGAGCTSGRWVCSTLDTIRRRLGR